MIQPQCIADQQVMGLETVHLRNLMIIYPELDYGDLGKQGQNDRGRWSCCRPLVPWDLLRLATYSNPTKESRFLGLGGIS